MRKLKLALAGLALGTMTSWAGTICPAGNGSTPFPHSPDPSATGCNVVITIAANGSLSSVVTDSTPYESSEDVLVGVVNNSSVQVNSISLTGSGIFGFESDGICAYTFVGGGYCSAAQYQTNPGNYAGPTTSFPGWTTSSSNTGTVAFSPGIAPGGSTYFSLEGIPTVLTGTVGSTGPVNASAPALSTWGMMLLVVLLVGLSFRMMKQQKTA